MACLRIDVCIIAACSALTAQQYCFSGAVTSTQGNSVLRDGDPVAVTIAIRPNTTSCTSNPYVKSCSAQITLRLRSGEREWTTDVNDPQDVENNKVGASASGMPPLGQGGTASQGATTMTFVTGAHSGPGLGVALHAALEFPGDLLARNDFPIGFPSPEDIRANKGQFHMMVITNPGGWAEVSYTGQECAHIQICPLKPSTGDLVLYWDDTGENIHVAEIAENGVKDNGDCTATVILVVSKWGDYGVYSHDPDDSIYGKHWTVEHRKIGDNSLLEDGGDYFTSYRQHEIYPCPTGQSIFACKPASKYTSAQALSQINHKCPGLSLYISQVAEPSTTYDCRGYVFAKSQVRIPPRYGFLNTDQIREILHDNDYTQVPAHHTGGHGCGMTDLKDMYGKGATGILDVVGLEERSIWQDMGLQR